MVFSCTSVPLNFSVIVMRRDCKAMTVIQCPGIEVIEINDIMADQAHDVFSSIDR